MILTGDCLESMKHLPDNSVDSIVSDPPYGLSFIGCELNPEYVQIAEKRIEAAVG